jgi:hypothetical protein
MEWSQIGGGGILFVTLESGCSTNMRKADLEKEGVGRRELLEQDFVIKPKAHNAP